MPDKPRTPLDVLPNLDEIRGEIKARQGWSLADPNRGSVLFLRLIDQLAQHVQLVSRGEVRTPTSSRNKLTPTKWREETIAKLNGFPGGSCPYSAMESWSLAQFKMAMNFALNYSEYVQKFDCGGA